MSNDTQEAIEAEGTVDAAGAITNDIAGYVEGAYQELGTFRATGGGRVRLAPEAELDADIIAAVLKADAVAVSFPKFADGRGYTHARRLREAGYERVIVAYGDIGLDQLHYLWRCGCDHFALRKGTDLSLARETLARFTHQYVGIRTVAQDGA